MRSSYSSISSRDRIHTQFQASCREPKAGLDEEEGGLALPSESIVVISRNGMDARDCEGA